MEKTLNRGKKRTAIILAAALTLTGAGIAFAYWTATGTGTGTATTGASVAFTITSEPPVGTLAPGSTGQTVDFTVTNAGEGTQSLTGVTVTLATADGTPWVPTGECLAADYTAVVTDDPSGEIAAGGSLTGTATVTLANTAVNQDDCQGQEVPLYFTAS
jgi:hypothetical protein